MPGRRDPLLYRRGHRRRDGGRPGVYLTVTFANQCYFGDDLSVPHSNGGSYMDVCGYFTLSAGLDGKILGSVDLKVAPYDNFHTMSEIL